MFRLLQGLTIAAMLSLSVSVGAQSAAPAVTRGAPEGYVAPADPKPEDTNAQRAVSQPGNNAPFWRAVRESGQQSGYTSLPGVEKGVLIQLLVQYPGSKHTTAGEAWRQVRNQWILPYGGALLLIVLLALALFYFTKGPIKLSQPETGRRIERFTYFERAAHWTNAIAFVALAISGIVMAFGKFFLLPILGGTLFGWLAYAMKTIHNFAGPLFAVSLVVVILTFVKDNWPSTHDLVWLAKGGGLFTGAHVPSHRFNAGEKLLFWGGVFVLGLIVVASGLVLDKLVPGLLYTRGEMQIAHMIHASAAVLMMAAFLGHIYMGTLGTQGAYQAMKTGYVDETWAKEHHELWYRDIQAGKIPAQRSTSHQAAAGKPAAQA
ncbi:MAG: formate dehydrogenase subunit gamma [Caldimonas sp.]|nr:MAG: formate dehydrogenase subunit gamma [Caldimonas sp.]